MAVSKVCFGLATSLVLFGCGSNSADADSKEEGSSIGDRLVLEIAYTQKYTTMPLNAKAATNLGWTVSNSCKQGLGHAAVTDDIPGLRLWFNTGGSLMGFGAQGRADANSDLTPPWSQGSDGHELDFLTRDPALACKNSVLESKSVGDRLLMVGVDAEGNSKSEEIPLSLDDAFAADYSDGGPCYPQMGWHMLYNRSQMSSPVPVYRGNGAGGKLLAMNLNSFAEQDTPAFEYPAPKEGKACYGFHMYFGDHEAGVCDKSPTAALIPFIETPKEKQRDYTCTPYFPNMWVQTLTTVVDTHSSEKGCAAVDGPCQFVHYAGPTNSDGYGTPCQPPSPTDGCHTYHQVTYKSECEDALATRSNLTARVDSNLEFNEQGVLKVCSDLVESHEKICWGPPASSPVSCECGDSTAQISV